MNFSSFQLWHDQARHTYPNALDCGETNLYRALAEMQPRLTESGANHQTHRCDLARAWLNRYGFPESLSRQALICRGIRHALTLVFREISQTRARVWLPVDVYPVYFDLARAAGIEANTFCTLPRPDLPRNASDERDEYLLIANPWKPLGRFVTEQECAALTDWVMASGGRRLLIDCVYDLGTLFHGATLKLMRTGRAVLLHSVTKGWLWPKTFGVALGAHMPGIEGAFRDEPPAQDQLNLAGKLLSDHTSLPGKVSAVLRERKQRLFGRLPTAVFKSLLVDSNDLAADSYFFPVEIPAAELLTRYGVIGIPADAFGATWHGTILTTLSKGFVEAEKNSNP